MSSKANASSGKKKKEKREITPIVHDTLDARTEILHETQEQYPYLKKCDPRLCAHPADVSRGYVVIYCGQFRGGMRLPLQEFCTKLLAALQLSPQQIGGTGWTVLNMCELLYGKGIPLSLQWFASKFSIKSQPDCYGVPSVSFALNKGDWPFHPFGLMPSHVKGWTDAPIRIKTSKLSVVSSHAVPYFVIDPKHARAALKKLKDTLLVGGMAKDIDLLIAQKYGGVAQVDWRHFMGSPSQRADLEPLNRPRKIIPPPNAYYQSFWF